jgi:hypothetical protein
LPTKRRYLNFYPGSSNPGRNRTFLKQGGISKVRFSILPGKTENVSFLTLSPTNFEE